MVLARASLSLYQGGRERELDPSLAVRTQIDKLLIRHEALEEDHQ
jgi:hypothetical protein